MRRIILIALDWTRPKDPPLSLGHASILANTLKHKISATEKSWAVNQSSFRWTQVVDDIMSHNSPDTDVAFGAYVWNEDSLQKILNNLKKENYRGRIILGGPQVSYLKSGLESFYPQVDVFIRGYAESALVDLANCESSDAHPDIAGVHFAGETDLRKSATIDLESLPSPYLEGIIKPQPFIRWETQRGCKFRCSFCQHREPDKALTRTKYLSMDRVKREAQWILDHPIIQDIAVLDPTFNSGHHYLDVMKSLHGYTGKLALQCRMEMVTPDFLAQVVEVNKTGNVVLEFGLQTIHKEEMRAIDRGNNMTKVEAVLKETKRLGIDIEVSLIFGLPGQTLESFKQSVDYCIQRQVRTIHAFPLMLLRGTPLYDRNERYQLVESTEIASEYIPRVQGDVIPHVVASSTFTYSDWKKMADLAEWLEVEYNTK